MPRFGLLPAAVCAFALVSLSPAMCLAQAAGTAGTIEAVTVYRGQALVTRVVEVAGGTGGGGTREIVVTDLPQRIQPASLHAESSGEVQVRSVRFRTRPVSQDVREEVRLIDVKIADFEQKMAVNRRRVELVGENKAYLASLQAFVAPTATAEMTKGVLNADTLEKLTTFMLAQREKLATTELTLGAEAKALAADMELAQREKQKLTAGSSRTAYEAVVLVSKETKGAGTVRLRYLVDNATWTPSYNVRTAADGAAGGAGGVGGGARSQAAQGSLVLDYYASIEQMSGEDWGDVSMTLSTATPSLVAKAPVLSAMNIALVQEQAQQMAFEGGYAKARDELSKKQAELEVQRQNRFAGKAGRGGGDREEGKDGRLDDKAFDQFLNTNAASIQVLDLTANERVVREPGGAKRASEEGLSVTYALSGKTSLPSRSDRQLIQIASMPMGANFVKLASPVLTSYVYDEAKVVNSSNMVLLAGPVTAYADGAFVGSGDLPTVSVGESFTVGFGIDSSLRTSREVAERSETIQGGNRVVELTYRLTVENFGAAPVSVRLLDRLPKARDGQIKVTLVSATAEQSTDAEFVKGAKKDGILRWDVQVPAQATGGTASTVEYKFRLEYDKQMSLVGM